jgi:Arc/MetJ-type ribon-helix-helix transcriptional regulator
MTIEITRPEVEALINQHLKSGLFHDVDELLAEALTALREKEQAAAVQPRAPLPAKDMVELFAPLRGLNMDFERDRDPGRDIQL